MLKLTKEEREKIREAVMKAEKKTAGEFVTVITRQSDSYFYIPFLWASVIALLAAPIMIFLFNLSEAKTVFQMQVVVMGLLYLILQVPVFKITFTPGSLKNIMAQKMAFEQFYVQGVSNTKERAGILFFVSYSEKFVEIIADEGINKLVKEGQWQHIVDEFIVNVKNGKVCDGFITAIEKCTAILSEHFPLKDGDINELSDRLVELDL